MLDLKWTAGAPFRSMTTTPGRTLSNRESKSYNSLRGKMKAMRSKLGLASVLFVQPLVSANGENPNTRTLRGFLAFPPDLVRSLEGEEKKEFDRESATLQASANNVLGLLRNKQFSRVEEWMESQESPAPAMDANQMSVEELLALAKKKESEKKADGGEEGDD